MTVYVVHERAKQPDGSWSPEEPIARQEPFGSNAHGSIELLTDDHVSTAPPPPRTESTMRPASPKHGELVHYGYKTTINSEPGTMPVGHMESITETWCAHCRSWVQTNGVLGPLRFMAEHRDGDCIGELP